MYIKLLRGSETFIPIEPSTGDAHRAKHGTFHVYCFHFLAAVARGVGSMAVVGEPFFLDGKTHSRQYVVHPYIFFNKKTTQTSTTATYMLKNL